jgi:tetratricopeptide (TPR) repeat protein
MERRVAARALFREGNRLSRIPLFARAAEQYAAALSLWKHPAFHFNLALAQLNLGQEVEARASLERALAHGEEPLGAKAQEARSRLQEVTRQLGRIRVTCRTPGAEVTLDGATLFIGPGSHQGWVKAAAHELTAKQAGFLSEARRVTVSAGELQDLELTLVTLTQATDASRRWAAWKPWAVAAAGATVAAAGGVLHALSARSFNAHDQRFLRLPCVTDPHPRRPGCTQAEIGPDLNGQLSRAGQQQRMAVGAYLAGGSLIAAGVALLYLNRPHLAERGAPARSAAIVPVASGDMIGVLMSVSR